MCSLARGLEWLHHALFLYSLLLHTPNLLAGTHNIKGTALGCFGFFFQDLGKHDFLVYVAQQLPALRSHVSFCIALIPATLLLRS